PFNTTLTPKEKQLISPAKRLNAAEAAKAPAGQRAPSRPPPGRRGPVEGTDGGPGGYAPNDPGRPAGRPAPPPPHPVRPTYQPPPQESTDMPEGDQGMGVTGPQAPPPGNQNVQGMFPLPNS